MYSNNGLIGVSGKWYGCAIGCHIKAALENIHDAPFVEIKGGSTAVFEAYYTVDKTLPTQAQFETLMDWCTAMSVKFEDATECWDLPWINWKG